MNVSENLKRIREKKGLSMKAVADKIGITPQGYSRYENGTSSPSIDNLKRISDALGVSVDEILLEPDEKNPVRILLNLLIESTKKEKLKWYLSESEEITKGEIIEIEYSTSANDNTVYSINQVPIFVPLSDEISPGLYLRIYDTQTVEKIADFGDYSEELTELWNTIELSVNGKSFIYDQIDELKKLLDEDKNADV